MNKFWDWMIDKDYSKYRDDENKYYINWDYDEFNKQMLIGYMIEYLIDNKELCIIIPKEFFIATHKDINSVYDYLENLITLYNIKGEK